MRKRALATKVGGDGSPGLDQTKQEGETATEVCASACQSLLDSAGELDLQVTARLAVCASKDAPLGHLRPFMKLLEISCHGIPWMLGTLVFFALAHRADDVVVSVNLMGVLLLDLVVVGMLKLIFRRSRPPHNMMDMFAAPSVDKFSFPSGHATRAAMLGWFLCEQVFPQCQVYCLLLGVWSVGVAASRILLGRHHISDVVCGFLIGLLDYHLYLSHLWIPQDTCMTYLDTYFGHVHL